MKYPFSLKAKRDDIEGVSGRPWVVGQSISYDLNGYIEIDYEPVDPKTVCVEVYGKRDLLGKKIYRCDVINNGGEPWWVDYDMDLAAFVLRDLSYPPRACNLGLIHHFEVVSNLHSYFFQAKCDDGERYCLGMDLSVSHVDGEYFTGYFLNGHNVDPHTLRVYYRGGWMDFLNVEGENFSQFVFGNMDNKALVYSSALELRAYDSQAY